MGSFRFKAECGCSVSSYSGKSFGYKNVKMLSPPHSKFFFYVAYFISRFEGDISLKKSNHCVIAAFNWIKGN